MNVSCEHGINNLFFRQLSYNKFLHQSSHESLPLGTHYLNLNLHFSIYQNANFFVSSINDNSFAETNVICILMACKRCYSILVSRVSNSRVAPFFLLRLYRINHNFGAFNPLFWLCEYLSVFAIQATHALIVHASTKWCKLLLIWFDVANLHIRSLWGAHNLWKI
jgi:hypothetical protein